MSISKEPTILNKDEVLENSIDADSQLNTACSPKVGSKTIWLSLGGAILVIGIIATLLINSYEESLLNRLPFLKELASWSFVTFVIVGFIAQMIDGALGMAYGISSTSMMMSAGVSPAAASAGVHAAEVFTSGASGLSHLFVGNVNKKLVKHLIIPGVIGAVLGAYVLTSIDGNLIKPYVSIYLMFMGIVVIRKAFKKKQKKKKTKQLSPLALFGGFMDSVGGGGWGPIVSSTLIGKGRSPKYTIGSVSLSEFFVAFASAGVFTLMLGFQNWTIVLGLIVGGVMAAPMAALVVGEIKTKPLMIMVGTLIILLSLRNILKALNDSGLIHLW